MKWLKRIGIALVVLVVLVVGVSFLLPSEYSVERSVLINADREQVHRLAGDLVGWQEWNPWIEMDPTIEVVLGEKTSGVGAHQEWTGKSGSGELTFTQADPLTGVKYTMAFDGGSYTASGAVDYEPSGDGTNVTWTMNGTLDGVMARYMGLMINSAVGPAYENGLATLKQMVEALPPPEIAPETMQDTAAAAEG